MTTPGAGDAPGDMTQTGNDKGAPATAGAFPMGEDAYEERLLPPRRGAVGTQRPSWQISLR